MTSQIILASSSKYRAMQLHSLGLTVDAIAPNIDESPNSDESPVDLCQRLAMTKAQSVAERYPEAIVIGSDQVAHIEGEPSSCVLGKPHTFDNAQQQLLRCSGRRVNFYTAVSIADKNNNLLIVEAEQTSVFFRELTGEDVSRYLNKEQPYDCAGSFKSEGLGVLLFERIESRDPNALIGLPVMLLRDLLQQHVDIDLLKLATSTSCEAR